LQSVQKKLGEKGSIGPKKLSKLVARRLGSNEEQLLEAVHEEVSRC